MEIINKLIPMPHSKLEDYWRVPVSVKGNVYKINIGENYIRTFNNKTIPDFVISKLTMARVTSEEWIEDDALSLIGAYIYTSDDGMGDVGWRVSNSIYIVILKASELRSLFGEDEDDTRSESKSKSKEILRWYQRLSFLANDGGLWKEWCSRYYRMLQGKVFSDRV